jgi:tetratricopeptide (TPR) repeat protein
VQLWQAGSGQALLTLRGHGGAVFAVAWSPDGRRLASAGFGGVWLWDTRSAKRLLKLRDAGKAHSVAWSADGRRLATVGPEGTVRLWEAARGRQLLSLPGHAVGWTAVYWSPDGRCLASVGAGAIPPIVLWRTGGGKELLVLRGHTALVTAVAFGPDGQRLYSRDEDGKVLAWDTTTGTQLPWPAAAVPFFRAGRAAQHPSRPLLALAVGDQVQLIHLSPPDAYESAFREGMARFDPWWHRDRAAAHQQSGDWFAAAFHWGQLAEHHPANGEYWRKLEAVCVHLGDWRPALAVCDRLRRRLPARAATYLRRARLRAHTFEFFEAAADGMAALALAAGNKDRNLDAADRALVVQEARRLPEPPARLNDAAWEVVKVRGRDQVAYALARRQAQAAVQAEPANGYYWNTLGVAHYRAGDWKAAIAALEKSDQLLKGHLLSFNGFFLAMAHRQLGKKDEARRQYDRAVRWMEHNRQVLEKDRQHQEELRRFRSEAAELLGVPQRALPPVR